MNKKVLVISTSMRQKGNSDQLADEFIKGAEDAGHTVGKITLYDKAIHFCKGCLACQNSTQGHCVFQDDADAIIKKMAEADVIAFATPIYFYEMSGQMKTLLDRSNPLFPIAYKFRVIYLLTSAADGEKSAMDGAIKGLQGWIDCFEEARLKGVVYGTASDAMNAILTHPETLQAAYEMGSHV